MLKRPLRTVLAGLGLYCIQASGANNVEANGLPPNSPTATVAVVQANYCFAEAHGILPERLPVPPLVLRLRLQVSYHDSGNRSLILPLDHQLTVWTSLGPGVMKILHQPVSILDPALKTMTHLPADVSPDSPISPANDVFGIIPAGGDMTAPLVEEVTLQIYKKTIRQRVDLRGQRVFIKLQLDHQPLASDFEAALSDRWTKFGVPWTGALRTNTLVFDIPAIPNARECVDVGNPRPARQRL